METALEHILTSSYKEGMISFLHSHSEYFEEALELAISNKQPYSWRAAWLLWSCIEENDKRVHGYISKIIDTIPSKEDGHQRELIKILTKMELNDEHEGRLFNICMNIWESINKRPSVRYNALVFILKIAKRHPELSGEIAFITQYRYLEPLSPGIRNSVSRIIKENHL
ncbi:MAG: hypothetical protein KAH17_01540 [Bacteroidales bacterium]|nr:hypothetical protein [Bacteroidales bacterium]